MSILKKTIISNFRNISLQELEFCRNMNCITGSNGEGKTNLLDAIWYLSMTKSAFTTSDSFNFRHGADEFAIAGTYEMENGRECRVSISVSAKGEKKLKHDDKPCNRMSDHIGLLPIVMVSPSDSVMISDSGDERRKFINGVLSQMDASYLSSLQQYNRLLLQRNRMLRDGNPDEGLLSIIDERMESAAGPVTAARSSFAESLLPSVKKYYDRISGSRETIDISYRTQTSEKPLAELLKEKRDADLAMKYTTAGIHRDDFIFSMNGYPIKRFGSQGQQKSFLVALKFAQYDIMKLKCGVPPILLLDDLFDKLDLNRVSNLLEMVSGNEFGQIFISDANSARTRSIVDGITSERRYFRAQGGAFTSEQD